MLFSGIIPIEIALHAYKQEKENEILNQIKENSEKKEKIMFEDKTLEQLEAAKKVFLEEVDAMEGSLRLMRKIIDDIHAEIEKRGNDGR